MGIPGSDLLADALMSIDSVTVEYFTFADRTLNAVGQYVLSYNTPIDVEASVQALPKKSYTQLGLDLKRQYVTAYLSYDVADLDRDVSGDRFVMPDGRRYQVESKTDWFMMDGWVACICVRIEFPPPEAAP